MHVSRVAGYFVLQSKLFWLSDTLSIEHLRKELIELYTGKVVKKGCGRCLVAQHMTLDLTL